MIVENLWEYYHFHAVVSFKEWQEGDWPDYTFLDWGTLRTHFEAIFGSLNKLFTNFSGKN